MGVEVFKEKRENARNASAAESEAILDQIEVEDMDCTKEDDPPENKDSDSNDIMDNEEGSAVVEVKQGESSECLEKSSTEKEDSALASVNQEEAQACPKDSNMDCPDSDDKKISS